MNSDNLYGLRDTTTTMTPRKNRQTVVGSPHITYAYVTHYWAIHKVESNHGFRSPSEGLVGYFLVLDDGLVFV